MRIRFDLATASLMIICLVFTVGCQNESAATKQSKPARMSDETSPQAMALDFSEHVASASADSTGDKRESSVSQVSEKSRRIQEVTLDGVLNLESNDPGALRADTEQTDAYLNEAWQK